MFDIARHIPVISYNIISYELQPQTGVSGEVVGTTGVNNLSGSTGGGSVTDSWSQTSIHATSNNQPLNILLNNPAVRNLFYEGEEISAEDAFTFEYTLPTPERIARFLTESHTAGSLETSISQLGEFITSFFYNGAQYQTDGMTTFTMAQGNHLRALQSQQDGPNPLILWMSAFVTNLEQLLTNPDFTTRNPWINDYPGLILEVRQLQERLVSLEEQVGAERQNAEQAASIVDELGTPTAIN